MSSKITIHKDRALFEIRGEDRKKFLQGLITNDVNKAGEKDLIYSAMLNASGRFLYDFFIFESSDKLMIDCLASRRDEILQKLNFYKLRSKIEIIKNDELAVGQVFSDEDLSLDGILKFSDPRNKELGYRIYAPLPLEKINTIIEYSDNSVELNSEAFYHYKRITLKIPESEHDLTYEKSFIAEFNFDNLNAIDYQKGCYIGQEPTARIHHLGQIRKKIIHIIIPKQQKIEKNCEITCEGKLFGLCLSSVLYENKLHALALVKIPENQNSDILPNLEIEENQIIIVN